MRNSKIYIGQRARVRGTFVDPETRDPATLVDVQVRFRRPDGSETLVAAVETTPGRWRGNILVDQSGTWQWRMYSATPGSETALEGNFYVQPSSF